MPFPRAIRLSGDYKADLLPLNQVLDATAAALERGLTIGENARGTFIDYEFRAPLTAAPVVRTGLSVAPKAVFIVGMWRKSPTYDAISVTGSCSWTFNNGSITLPWLNGVAGTDLYMVRLLILEA